MNYWPEEQDRPEGAGPLRYVAIRMRKRQGDLFTDGSEAKYFAVASNRWDWEGKKLLEWHREKAGSIEALHDVLKNELAAGVMPCGRFGANAAWLRLAVMTHNLLTALKRIGLPEPWLRARPKRLHFQIFCAPGKLVRDARQLLLRVARWRDRLAEWDIGRPGRAFPLHLILCVGAGHDGSLAIPAETEQAVAVVGRSRRLTNCCSAAIPGTDSEQSR